MADSKKNVSSLEGKDVEIFLTTPLFRFRYVLDGKERELLENAVRISGSIVKEVSGGFLVKAKVIGNMREKENELPFDTIYLPSTKIDFMVID